MNDPAIPPASQPLPPAAPEPTVKPSERVRIFTPIDVEPSVQPKRFGRLTPMDVSAGDILAPAPDELEAEHPRGTARPALVPNSAIPFLQQVHATSDPEQLDRRVSIAVRTVAYSALALVVGLAIASGFIFKARPVTRTGTGTASSSAPIPALPVLTAADSARLVREALTALDAFLVKPTAEGLPTPMAREKAIPGLGDIEVDRDNARLLAAHGLKIVLVPVTGTDGLPRTAAVLNRGDGWRVDGRSVITPETAAWQDIVAGSVRGPHLCRVELSREPDGTWLATRPAPPNTQVSPSFVPGSRVPEELARALADGGGATLVADVFFETDAARRLNIIDWTKDKWSL